jgi:hypothetical protein
MRRSRSLSFAAVALLAVAPLARPLIAQDAPSAPSSGPAIHAVALTRIAPVDARAALPLPTPSNDAKDSGFAASGFAQFMASPAGRIVRVIAGAGMIAGGINADGNGGTAVAIVGAVPLLAGAFDFCVISPLFGGPFWGKDIRAAKGK